MTFTLINIPGGIKYKLLATSDWEVNTNVEENAKVREVIKEVIFKVEQAIEGTSRIKCFK